MSRKRKTGPHFGQRKLTKLEPRAATCRRCLATSMDVELVDVRKANGVDFDRWAICRECVGRADHAKWVRRREEDRRIMAERSSVAERESASVVEVIR